MIDEDKPWDKLFQKYTRKKRGLDWNAISDLWTAISVWILPLVLGRPNKSTRQIRTASQGSLLNHGGMSRSLGNNLSTVHLVAEGTIYVCTLYRLNTLSVSHGFSTVSQWLRILTSHHKSTHHFDHRLDCICQYSIVLLMLLDDDQLTTLVVGSIRTNAKRILNRTVHLLLIFFYCGIYFIFIFWISNASK